MVAENKELPSFLDHKNMAGIPDHAVILLGMASAVLSAVGSLTTLVEAASLSFLFTFCIVCALAFIQRVGMCIVTAFGALSAAAASIALIIRLLQTNIMALIFLCLLALIAFFVRPLLMRQTNI
jgi:hypothetical protein